MRGSALLLIAQASGHAIAPEAQDVDISLYTGLTTPSRISGTQKCKCIGGNGQEHFIGNTVAGTLRRRRGAPGATCGTGNNEECIPTPRYPASYGEACEAHAELLHVHAPCVLRAIEVPVPSPIQNAHPQQ